MDTLVEKGFDEDTGEAAPFDVEPDMIVYAEQDKWGFWTLQHYEEGEAGGVIIKHGRRTFAYGSPRKTFSTRLRSFNQFLAREVLN